VRTGDGVAFAADGLAAGAAAAGGLGRMDGRG
jgi:hypothetical protein